MLFLVVFLKYFLSYIKTLLDPNRNLSLMALYSSRRFGDFVVQLLYPYSVSIHLGESILVRRVYRYCTISIYHNDTIADLVSIDIVDVYFVLVMDSVHACYASVECRAGVVTFLFHNEKGLK